MKVILNDYVERLGERGDVVSVKPGFARNYLLPRALAYPDTPGNRRRFEQEQKTWEQVDLGRRSAAEKVAQSLAGVSLRFERRAGEKDALFGSVTTQDIARELKERGFEIDKRRIELTDPIKALGRFEVPITVHRDISVNLPVEIVRPGDLRAQAEAAEPPTEA